MMMFDHNQYWPWDFDNFIHETSKILCPKCNEWSLLINWDIVEVYCEDCGEHEAMKCPNCDENFDHVYSKEFKVKND